MRNVVCKNCDNKIPVIDLRISHFNGRDLTCPNCPRTWPHEQLGIVLDQIDIKRLRKDLHKALDKGTICPCCEHYAKRYRRKFNSIMACWLIAFYRAQLAHPEEDYIHVSVSGRFLHSDVSIRSGDYGKARFWGLLEPSGEQISGKKEAGCWRLTDEGREFVKGVRTIPREAVVYNNVVQGFEGPQIGVQEALGERFDYDELMAIPPPAHV